MLSIALQPEGLQLVCLLRQLFFLHGPGRKSWAVNSIAQPKPFGFWLCSLIAQPNRRLGCASFLFLHGPGRKSWAVNSGRKPTRRVGLLVNTWPNPVRGWAVLRVKSTRRVDFTSYLLQSTTLRVVQQALHVAGWREIAAFPLRIYG